MKEALIHYIWQNALLDQKEYLSDTGEQIKIHQQGTLNTDAGPDFTNAKLEIDGTLWVGNVEIHRQASDWYLHKHETNLAYNNVILHVVLFNDRECKNAEGRIIPTIAIEINPTLINKYNALMQSELNIPCSKSLKKLEPARAVFWLSALAIDRLALKTEAIQALLKSTNNSWEESFYIQLTRSLGLKINAVPFELFSKSLPLKILNQQPDNVLRAEALIYGQAGFLEGNSVDEYHASLKKEYTYHRNKYNLVPIENHLWKFLRSRPLNFPTIRLAQLSSLILKSTTVFSQILDFDLPNQVVDFFSCQVNEYWKNHYTFGKKSAYNEKKLGRNTIFSIIINTVIPFMFIYGEYKNNNTLKEKAINWLEQLPPENNQITRTWKELGVKPRHAADSQALIQLTNSYCRSKKCLSCQIGHLVLKPHKA